VREIKFCYAPALTQQGCLTTELLLYSTSLAASHSEQYSGSILQQLSGVIDELSNTHLSALVLFLPCSASFFTSLSTSCGIANPNGSGDMFWGVHAAAAALPAAAVATWTSHINVLDFLLLLVYILSSTLACARLAHHSSCTRAV
jgi:hypothetical protein